MRHFENQEQQDGDEDEADKAPLGLLSRGFWYIYIGQFGKGQAATAEFKMEHLRVKSPMFVIVCLLLYISSFTESDYIYILNFVATISTL